MKVSDYARSLENAGIPNSGQESLWLIAHALGITHTQVLARDSFSESEGSRIDALVSRRINGEPLQYILGLADFYGRDFRVGSGVLIPRRDTETLIDGVKSLAGREDEFVFMDWGTGSGCIAITLLLEFPNSFAFMVENSTDASRFALENLSRYNLGERARIVPCMDGVSDCRFIVSNPPYIPSSEIDGLESQVRDFEPISALDGGQDGMSFYRQILTQAPDVLLSDGYIIFEVGSSAQVRELETMSDGFELERKFMDGSNFPRCIILRRKQR